WYVADLSPAWWWGSNDWPGTTDASKDIGSELDLHLKFGKDPNRVFTAGYSLFFPGKLITDWSESHWGWGQKDTAQWAYVQTEFKF
ncbi:MAG: hypothetical protein HOH25_05035, partial [Opitutae bacterium]|nr:hypothetical protein [Opitutae bacterium]